MSLYSKSCNLHSENLDTEELIARTSQYDVNKSTQDEEDKEDCEEFLECVEWNDDVCATTGSIELECLSELELMLSSKVKEISCTTEPSLHDKLKELKQNMTNMLETIKLLKAELKSDRLLLDEMEKERNMLADRSKCYESNEQRLYKTVEDLKRQNVLLTDLVIGVKDKPTRAKG